MHSDTLLDFDDTDVLSSTPLPGMMTLVTASQLPTTPTPSQKHTDTVKQLIRANVRIAELEKENKELRDEALVKHIRVSEELTQLDREQRPASFLHVKNNRSRISFCDAATETETTPVTPTPPDSKRKGMVLFRSDGNMSILSNFYLMRLRHRGTNYISAEQAYQHQMALFHARSDIAHRIMTARTSAQTKRISKSVRKCVQWQECKTEIMAEILLSKAKQNEKFRHTLLKTHGKSLIHNIDTDSFWGCGPDFEGQNMMGVLLEELRANLSQTSSLQTTPPKPPATTPNYIPFATAQS
jgi:ribA/ribD-fused uncharacterized protein